MESLDATQRERATMMASTLAATVRGVARHGPDSQLRVQAVFEEVAASPTVRAVSLLDEGAHVIIEGGAAVEGWEGWEPAQAFEFTQRGDELAVVLPFELSVGQGQGRSQRMRRGEGALSTGRYTLVLILDAFRASDVRSQILITDLALLVIGLPLPLVRRAHPAAGGAHVEFFRGLRNPIDVKIGPTMDPAELVELCRVLDPEHEPGRLTLIHRMGKERVAERLPALVEAVLSAGWIVTWCCDPMHGNTYATSQGIKTRRFDDILGELEQAFCVHDQLGSVLGGVHFELTGQDVTEVVGGARGMSEADLGRAYESVVDPRLNYEQSLEMAFLIARHVGGRYCG